MIPSLNKRSAETSSEGLDSRFPKRKKIEEDLSPRVNRAAAGALQSTSRDTCSSSHPTMSVKPPNIPQYYEELTRAVRHSDSSIRQHTFVQLTQNRQLRFLEHSMLASLIEEASRWKGSDNSIRNTLVEYVSWSAIPHKQTVYYKYVEIAFRCLADPQSHKFGEKFLDKLIQSTPPDRQKSINIGPWFSNYGVRSQNVFDYFFNSDKINLLPLSTLVDMLRSLAKTLDYPVGPVGYYMDAFERVIGSPRFGEVSVPDLASIFEAAVRNCADWTDRHPLRLLIVSPRFPEVRDYCLGLALLKSVCARDGDQLLTRSNVPLDPLLKFLISSKRFQEIPSEMVLKAIETCIQQTKQLAASLDSRYQPYKSALGRLLKVTFAHPGGFGILTKASKIEQAAETRDMVRGQTAVLTFIIGCSLAEHGDKGLKVFTKSRIYEPRLPGLIASFVCKLK